MTKHFRYTQENLLALKKKDKRLCKVIDSLGVINRELDGDIFPSLVRAIIGQQISTKAQKTICLRLQNGLEEITPKTLAESPQELLQSFGISLRKVGYIKEIANKILSGEIDTDKLHSLSDDEVCIELTKLNGIGIWTAQMLMIFSMERTNILSYNDLGIQRGLRMLYRHKKITKELHLKYFKRYSPYNTLASFYLWAISANAIPELSDPCTEK